MPTLDAVSRAITDENLTDLRVTAWYGAIGYWAWEVEKPDASVWFDIYEHEDHTREERSANRYKVTGKMLKVAFLTVLEDNTLDLAGYIRNYFRRAWDERDDDGIDMTHIDAEAADVWVQVAVFGKIIYG